jgi:hypothetical protein
VGEVDVEESGDDVAGRTAGRVEAALTGLEFDSPVSTTAVPSFRSAKVKLRP